IRRDRCLMLDDWVWTIGEAVAPFGLKGELKVNYETDFPERFDTLKQVCLRPRAAAPKLFKVERVRHHKGQVLVKLEGIESIDDADAWRGAKLQVPRTEAVVLPEGSYYAADMIGAEVYTKEGRLIGTLDRVLPYPAQDLYQVGDILIPAV